MSQRVRSSPLQTLLGGRMAARLRRAASAGAVSVTLAALILGSAYGQLSSVLALLGAVLLGAVLYWQGEYVRGKVVYGNLVIATFLAPALSVVAISAVLSLTLQVPFTSVVWATATKVLINSVTVLFMLLVGVVAAIAVSAVGVGLDDGRAAVLLVASLVAFVAIQVRVGRLVPETAMLTTPMYSDATTQQLRLYGIASIVAGSGVLTAVGATLSSRSRMQLVLAGLLVSSLLVGAAGVGRVQGSIYQLQEAEAIGKQVTVETAAVELTDEGVRLRLELTNPTDTEIERRGAFVEMHDADGSRLTFGPAAAASNQPETVPPGETVTVTYRIPLTDSTVAELRQAIDDGEVLVTGKQSFDVTDTEFTVEFRCVWDGETCTPTDS